MTPEENEAELTRIEKLIDENPVAGAVALADHAKVVASRVNDDLQRLQTNYKAAIGASQNKEVARQNAEDALKKGLKRVLKCLVIA